MNLDDLNSNKIKKLESILESRFGKKVNLSNSHPRKAAKLLKQVTEAISAYKKSSKYNADSTNPAYLELLVIREGLHAHIADSLKSKHAFRLTEGEIQVAEAVLAAKDFVDRLQKMIEDVGRMLNEDLLPLTDIIRDQMGANEAEQYATTATSVLSELQQKLQEARAQMDNAARALAGEGSFQSDMEMPGNDEEDMSDIEDLDDLEDLDSEEDNDLEDLDFEDDVEDEEEALPGAGGVGRETR